MTWVEPRSWGRLEAELHDLRALVAAMVEKAGGEVTLSADKVAAHQRGSWGYEVIIDGTYRSITIRSTS